MNHNDLIKSTCEGSTEIERTYTAGDCDYGVHVCKRCGSTITTPLGCYQHHWAREKECEDEVMEAFQQVMAETGIDDNGYGRTRRKFKSRSMIRLLSALRLKKDISPKDLADKMGISCGDLLKLEEKEDHEITFGEFGLYIDALEVEFQLTIDEFECKATFKPGSLEVTDGTC